MDKNTKPIQMYQKSEVSKVGWFNCEDCLKIIRPYNLERIDIIKNINRILQNYTIY